MKLLWSVIDGTPLQILGKILSDVYVSATIKMMFKWKDDMDDTDDNDTEGEEYEHDDEEEAEEMPVIIQKIKCEPSASTSKFTPEEKKTQLTPQRQKSNTKTPPRQTSDTKTPQGKNLTPRHPKAKTPDSSLANYPKWHKETKIKGGSGQEGGSRGSPWTYEI